MLGTELSRQLKEAGLSFTGTDRELSILEPQTLRQFASDLEKPLRWIINCAAYTAVDKAEDDQDLCYALNAQGPENLARLASESGASLLHVSTDYVFSGDGSTPYDEDAPHNPGGVYGRSKSEGEKRASSLCKRLVVLRTAWLYGRHGPNFVYTMLRLMKERQELAVVNDQKGSPTWAADLAAAIIKIVQSPAPVYGNYHYTNDGVCTWYEFAREIERLGNEYGLLERSIPIQPLSSNAYPTKAKRPAYSVLSKTRISRDYDVILPDWKQSLKTFIADLAQNSETI